MTIKVGSDYRFDTAKSEIDNEITEDHLLQGRVSEPIFDNYYEFSQMDGLTVTVVSVKSVRNISGCDSLAKVFLKDEGYTFWFTARSDELTSLATQESNKGCTCDLGLLMVRGCRCGGA